MAEAVQLRGTPVILAAFDRIDIATWALFYKNKCLFKCVGEDLEDSKAKLKGFLNQMEASNTSATYELGFYDGVKDKKKIRNIQEADYAYNVVLFNDDDYLAPGTVARRDGYALLAQRLDDLTAQLAVRQKTEEEEEDPEPEKVGSVGNRLLAFFDKLLDNPHVEQKIGQLVTGWMDRMVLPASNTLPMTVSNESGAIGAIPPDPGQTMITQEQAQKIQLSIEILASVDPQLGDHLEKIAQLARTNPNRYKNLITMLNSFI